MDADLDTLATALYVTTDDLLKAAPQLAPWRPTVGIAPKLSDAELVTLAVLQALLGFAWVPFPLPWTPMMMYLRISIPAFLGGVSIHRLVSQASTTAPAIIQSDTDCTSAAPPPRRLRWS